MKKFLFFFLIIASLSSFAQEETPKCKAGHYTSDKGYWVIESNVKSPKNSTIYFYTTQDQLVYKETVEGTRININRKKVLLRLKNVLEQSVLTYEQNHKATQDQMLVTLALKK